MRQLSTGSLDVGYVETGPSSGTPVILLHGFPYGIQAYSEVAELLATHRCRCIVPYLRGFGSTRFLSDATMRSGQQAALGHDLIALMDALGLPSAAVAGYDWGGRAACIAAALWPERVRGLVTAEGYNIQDIAGATSPKAPEEELRLWYQYYFGTERGRAGLASHRQEFCRLLWRLWSPSWHSHAATFDATAAAFDNPDFVDVVIHSYRHRFGAVRGDPAFDSMEAQLAAKPPIAVPTVALHGADDGVATGIDGAEHFTGWYQARTLPGIGHNIPQEAPEAFAQAVLDVLAAATAGPARIGAGALR